MSWKRMTPVLISVLLYSSAALCDSFDAVFRAENGATVQLNTLTGDLHTQSSYVGLRDCSDKFQFCFSDHEGFAFSYFRKCDDATISNYQRLRFPPKVISALHDDLWMVFDKAPNYLFHYVRAKGIIGINIGAPSFDFRSVLHDKSFRVGTLDASEYHLVSSHPLAACLE